MKGTDERKKAQTDTSDGNDTSTMACFTVTAVCSCPLAMSGLAGIYVWVAVALLSGFVLDILASILREVREVDDRLGALERKCDRIGKAMK